MVASALATVADALGDGTAAVEDGGLDGAARGAVQEPKNAVGEAAADNVDAVAAAEMVADEVSCCLDRHTRVKAAKTGKGIVCRKNLDDCRLWWWYQLVFKLFEPSIGSCHGQVVYVNLRILGKAMESWIF